MKKFIAILVFATLALMLGACGQKEKKANVLVLGTNPTYPPYESVGAEGQCEGYDIDVAAAIAEKLNKQLEIREFEFDALILALKQDKIDVVLSGLSITPSRQKEIEMIPYQGDPVRSLYLAFWKNRPSFKSISELGMIAVQVATLQEGYLRTVEGAQWKSLEGNVEIVMELQHQKSQAAIFEPNIANALVKRFPDMQLVELPLEEKDWFLGNEIGINKKNTALIEQVKQAVDELRADGKLKELEKKWMQSNE